MAEDTAYTCPECGSQFATDSETGETVCSDCEFALKKDDIDGGFDCLHCQRGSFGEEKMKQYLLTDHEQAVRDNYPPTSNPFYSNGCTMRGKGKLQDDLRCDSCGEDCIAWWVGEKLFARKLAASD